jgi:uncharacterized protein
MKKMNPVVHFEMPAADRNRMAEFYARVFGWKTQMLDEEMGNYVIATTSENDANGRPLHPGTINGGFYPVSSGNPLPAPSVVIAVEDIVAAMEEVTQAGGKVLGEPHVIPGIGNYVSFLDTENNRVSMLQPLM